MRIQFKGCFCNLALMNIFYLITHGSSQMFKKK
nr:MAG TPA: hypothetical protein [Bacteriophage sp.]